MKKVIDMSACIVFESHKKVIPYPMTRLEYNQYRGWELPSDENGDDEGYLVEYLDGGKPNVEGHYGYVSWSPKEQFDNGYTKVVDLDFLGRLKVEIDELDLKRKNLEGFMITPGSAFSSLPGSVKGLMHDQLEHMNQYAKCLKERHELLTDM